MRSVVIEPTSEPLTFEKAAQHLRLDGADEHELVEDYIVAARDYCEDYIDRAIPLQTREVTFDGFECNPLRLEPLRNIVSITYLDSDMDEQTVDPLEYHVNAPAGLVQSMAGWPSAADVTGSVTIRYEAGMSNVPQAIVQAMLLLVGHWYENREAGSRDVAKEIAFSVEALLARHRWTVGIA